MISAQKAHRSGLRRRPLKLLSQNDNNTGASFSMACCLYDKPEPTRNQKLSAAKERQRAERNQLIRTLKESPVKRDARNFLKHFDTPKQQEVSEEKDWGGLTKAAVERAYHNEWRLSKTGVNLGNLYQPTKAIENSPVFVQQPEKDSIKAEATEPLHVALVKLRQPQALDDKTLGGIALTLSQMVRLGLNIAVIFDCDAEEVPDALKVHATGNEISDEQAARIVDALEEFNEPGAFVVDQALAYSEAKSHISSSIYVRGRVEVKNNDLLLGPLEDGIIPVIPPVAYTSGLTKRRILPDEVLLALTREFAGITEQGFRRHSSLSDAVVDKAKGASDKPLLDRIIILDPLGGLPSEKRADGAHIFVNLEAEYKDVMDELGRLSSVVPPKERNNKQSLLGQSNPFSHFAENEASPTTSSTEQLASSLIPARHLENLDVIHHALKLLPPSSSALIITPAEAAISSQSQFIDTPSTGVRTRRSKNPLIHNLLTDKPMVSSSLPPPLVPRQLLSAEPNPPTFLKKGIPVTCIPDPRSRPWAPPSASNPSIRLEDDPRINFPKLVDLIEDSFRRKLDTKHYLDRIRGRVAGVIIAGNYEGGAICTWEKPSRIELDFQDPLIWVPYLDKFAVLTSSQGSGGVADIVWGALTRSCFPSGLVWRSRSSNPVNKWYFERAVGMWNLAGGDWTMFWTTSGVAEEWGRRREGVNTEGVGPVTRWEAYVDVCNGVLPSWADGRKPD